MNYNSNGILHRCLRVDSGTYIACEMRDAEWGIMLGGKTLRIEHHIAKANNK